MKSAYVILLTLSCLFLFGVSSDVRACICFERQPPCVDYWQADAVFVGRVLQVSPDYKDYEASNRIGRRTVLIALEQSFRGVAGEQVKLESDVSDCEFRFEAGEPYFVYAYRDKATNTLETSGCSRTTSLAHAKEDLAFLEQLSGGAQEFAILGLVVENSYNPVEGLTIHVQGSHAQYEATTDTEGRFRITLPAAGKYTVRLTLPKSHHVLGPTHQMEMITRYSEKDHVISLEYEVEVSPNKCVFIVIPTLAERHVRSG
jgi:hypothetical protein